jgi:uncharacterized membrane protein
MGIIICAFLMWFGVFLLGYATAQSKYENKSKNVGKQPET